MLGHRPILHRPRQTCRQCSRIRTLYSQGRGRPSLWLFTYEPALGSAPAGEFQHAQDRDTAQSQGQDDISWEKKIGPYGVSLQGPKFTSGSAAGFNPDIALAQQKPKNPSRTASAP